MRRVLAMIVLVGLTLTAAVRGQPVTFMGGVVGLDGQPVEGCRVMVADWPDGDRYGAPVWAETTTDAAGRFRLPATHLEGWPTRSVIAIKEGLAIGWAHVPEGGVGGIRLRGEMASCTGRVTDGNDRPLAGISVWVGSVLMRGKGIEPTTGVDLQARLSPLRAVTDAEGGFEIPGLPAGASVDLCARGEGWGYYTTPHSAAHDIAYEAALKLLPEARISGRATREGEPIAGVRVSAGPEEAVTGADGSYTIGCLPEGTYCVAVDAGADHVAPARQEVEARSGEDTGGVDFALTEGAVVEGTVTMADTGEPAVGALIKTHGPARPGMCPMRQVFRTDEDGRYSVRLAAGMNHVAFIGGVAGYAGEDAEEPSRPFELEEGEVRTGVDIVLHPPRKLGGIVLGPDGQPIPGVNVWAQRQLSPEPVSPDPVQTDEQGRFVLPLAGNIGIGLASDFRDCFMIFAQDTGGGLAGCMLTETVRQDVTVQLQRGAYLGTVVRDMEGDPVPGVLMRYSMVYGGQGPWWRPPFEGESDAEGRLVLGPLPPVDEVRLWFEPQVRRMLADRDWDSSRAYSLQEGQTLEIAELLLDVDGREVRGKVLDDHGQPAAGVDVVAPTNERATKTDAQGVFELTHLEARGELSVLAMTADRKQACGVTIDPDTTPEVELTLQTAGVLQGVAYDPEGQPRADVEITLIGRGVNQDFGAPGPLTLIALKRSDERGRFLFEGLVPGLTYEIQAMDIRGSHYTERREFVAEPGPEPDVSDLFMQ